MDDGSKMCVCMCECKCMLQEYRKCVYVSRRDYVCVIEIIFSNILHTHTYICMILNMCIDILDISNIVVYNLNVRKIMCACMYVYICLTLHSAMQFTHIHTHIRITLNICMDICKTIKCKFL